MCLILKANACPNRGQHASHIHSHKQNRKLQSSSNLPRQRLPNRLPTYLYCRALSMYSCCSIMTESAAETSMMFLTERKSWQVHWKNHMKQCFIIRKHVKSGSAMQKWLTVLSWWGWMWGGPVHLSALRGHWEWASRSHLGVCWLGSGGGSAAYVHQGPIKGRAEYKFTITKLFFS